MSTDPEPRLRTITVDADAVDVMLTGVFECFQLSDCGGFAKEMEAALTEISGLLQTGELPEDYRPGGFYASTVSDRRIANDVLNCGTGDEEE